MEIIIAIVIVVAFVAVWYNRRSPAAAVVEAETSSDNGIKFTAKEEAPVEATKTPAKKSAAKKPAVKKAVEKKPAVKKAPAKTKKTTS